MPWDTNRYQGPLAKALRRWWNAASHVGRLDPWPKEIDEAVRSREAQPVCSNCLMPQDQHFWFCGECGYPSGEYMTVMPYLHLFALGQFLQRGVVGEPERRAWVLNGDRGVKGGAPTSGGPTGTLQRRAVGRPICDRGRPQLTVEASEDKRGDGPGTDSTGDASC